MTDSSNLPLLHQLFGGYFNQDWMLDDQSWQGVIDRFTRMEPRSTVADTHRELVSLLASEKPEPELAREVLDTLGSYYDPRGTGGTMRGWLEQIAAMLGERVQR